jgi:hypothetical protein
MGWLAYDFYTNFFETSLGQRLFFFGKYRRNAEKRPSAAPGPGPKKDVVNISPTPASFRVRIWAVSGLPYNYHFTTLKLPICYPLHRQMGSKWVVKR